MGVYQGLEYTPRRRSRQNIYWGILVVLAAIIEATGLVHLRLQGAVPDLILLLVVYYSIASGGERAMMTGLLGGIFQDVAADKGLGHHVLCLVIVGYIGDRISSRLITDHPAVKSALVFAACLIHGLLFTSIEYVQKPETNAIYAYAVDTVPRAFYTALVTPVVFFLLDRFQSLTGITSRNP